VEPHEIGGIIGVSTSIESLTRVIAPILGGYLLVAYGAWAPGLFGAILLGGLSVYVWNRIYDHPIMAGMRVEPALAEQPAGP
jgi:DHA1 family tetracycline resistance protein-like MFS transporter